MVRPASIAAVSGIAKGTYEVLSNPLLAISQPILLNSEDWSHYFVDSDFDKMLVNHSTFVIGGVDFIETVKIHPHSYNNMDNQIRARTSERMTARGWDPLIDRLRIPGKSREPFGNTKLNEWFRTWKGRQPASEAKRQNHPVRLQKAIEFIALTEENLHWQFEHRTVSKTYPIFEQECARLGLPCVPESIWSILWIEPVIYACSKPLGASDILAVLDNDNLVQPILEIGQSKGALLWALMGQTVKRATAEAACKIINTYRGNGNGGSGVVSEPYTCPSAVRFKKMEKHVESVFDAESVRELKARHSALLKQYELITERGYERV